MTDLDMKLTVDTSEARAEIDELGLKAEDTDEKVDAITEHIAMKTDIAFMKAVQTAQKVASLVNRIVGLMGDNVSKVTRASISFATMALETFAPLMTTMAAGGTVNPWMAIQATIGFAALTMAGTRLHSLVQEEKSTQSAFNTINMDVGRMNW